MNNSTALRAKCDTTVVCFLLIILGQGWLLRNVLLAGPAAWPLAVIGEMLFCVVLLAAVVWCWSHPLGWTNQKGCAAAFAVFAVYAAFTLVNYSTFAQMYLAGIQTEYPSWGKALVALKLLLAIMGIVAGIPVAPPPSGREYADKMRQVYYRQEAEQAKANAKGAKQDLDSIMAKLKENLSPEEMNALMSELRAEAAQSAGAPAPAEQEPAPEREDLTETWRGWGGGV